MKKYTYIIHHTKKQEERRVNFLKLKVLNNTVLFILLWLFLI